MAVGREDARAEEAIALGGAATERGPWVEVRTKDQEETAGEAGQAVEATEV